MERVYVLGGGFAGLAALHELVKWRKRGLSISIHLVDAKPHSVFVPLLPDLISGTVRPEHICFPFEPHCRDLRIDFLQATIDEIDVQAGRIRTDKGSFEFDYMINCLGCVNNYFGRDDAKANTLALTGITDTLAIAAEAMRLVDTVHPPERPTLLIVGGGYTGFEVAAHVVKSIHRKRGIPYSEIPRVLDLRILEVADTVLPHSTPRVRDWASDLIRSYGVDIRTGTSIDSFGPGKSVRLSDGTELHDALTVWATGMTPGPVSAGLPVEKVASKRLAVDAHLRLPGMPNVFAAGDVAGPVPPGKAGPLYMSVQFSLRGGAIAAGNIARTIKGEELAVFDPVDIGYVVPLAPGRGAGRVLGFELSGRLPYYMHYFMSMFRTWGWQNRRGVLRDVMTGAH